MSISEWSKKWDKPPARETVGAKIKNFISPPPPAKHQIIQAIYKIGGQINRLEFSLNKLHQYDKQLFERVVNALMQGDKSRATMYANEVAEVRKMAKVLMTIKYALERVKLRLETALIAGETYANLAPAIVALKQVTGYLKGMMPDIFTELIEVEESLNVALMQMSSTVPIDLSSEFVTQEARKIIEEASVVAEQRLRQQFPELPSLQVPSSQEETGVHAGETR